MYCTSVLFQCIMLQNLHTRKKGTVCHRGLFATPGDMACLVCFVNQLFINLGILSDHASFLNSATMLMPSDVIYSWSSFVGKIYTYHRSEHSPGVRFCKYLLVHLLTGRHVCFSYFAFIVDCVRTWVVWSVWISNRPTQNRLSSERSA